MALALLIVAALVCWQQLASSLCPDPFAKATKVIDYQNFKISFKALDSVRVDVILNGIYNKNKMAQMHMVRFDYKIANDSHRDIWYRFRNVQFTLDNVRVSNVNYNIGVYVVDRWEKLASAKNVVLPLYAYVSDSLTDRLIPHVLISNYGIRDRYEP